MILLKEGVPHSVPILKLSSLVTCAVAVLHLDQIISAHLEGTCAVAGARELDGLKCGGQSKELVLDGRVLIPSGSLRDPQLPPIVPMSDVDDLDFYLA